MNQSEELYYGTVKVYFPIKGYGFITRSEKKDVFFYYEDVRDEADALEGSRVRFQVQETEKGPRALNVERVG